MTSQIGRKVIIIHILPVMSRSKGNEAMEFGQSIKNSMRIIFLQI